MVAFPTAAKAPFTYKRLGNDKVPVNAFKFGEQAPFTYCKLVKVKVVASAKTGLKAPVTATKDDAVNDVNAAIVTPNAPLICWITPRSRAVIPVSVRPSSNVAVNILDANPALLTTAALYKLN